MIFRPSRFWSLLLLAFVCMAGCGSSSDTVAIHGNVTFHSQPLASAALTFFPEQGRPVTAAVTNGAYQADVPTGEYVVAVNIGMELPPNYKEGEPVPPPKVKLPEQYTSRVKTPLKATVNSSNQTIDFALK
jgi:hypothetical protein